MSHNIRNYIGRQAAWHRLGTVTGKYNRWSEILQAGGLGFQVEKRQLNYQGRPVEAWGTFRNDTDEFLGMVGSRYQVIQHTEGFDLVDRLMGEVNGAHYETAGVLGKGEQVWGLAALNRSVFVGDDETKTYLLFVAAHDRSLGYQFRLCMERVVCANTLAVALAEKTAAKLSIRHTRSGLKKVDELKIAADEIGAQVSGVGDRLNFLATRKVTRETMVSIMDRLFPPVKLEDGQAMGTGHAAAITRRENVLSDILMRYESNDRNAFPEQRGSFYNLLNAITESVDHGGNPESTAPLFGAGDARKREAYELLTVEAGNAPLMPARQVFAPAPRLAPAPAAVRSTGSLLDEILASA